MASFLQDLSGLRVLSPKFARSGPFEIRTSLPSHEGTSFLLPSERTHDSSDLQHGQRCTTCAAHGRPSKGGHKKVISRRSSSISSSPSHALFSEPTSGENDAEDPVPVHRSSASTLPSPSPSESDDDDDDDDEAAPTNLACPLHAQNLLDLSIFRESRRAPKGNRASKRRRTHDGSFAGAAKSGAKRKYVLRERAEIVRVPSTDLESEDEINLPNVE